LRLATARLRSLLRKANFDPNQPRVPRGASGGGRWTDGGAGNGSIPTRSAGEPVRLAQARGGRGGTTPTLRLPGGLVELSPSQAMRYEAARTSAAIETARVRAIPGSENWQPPAGAYSSVEGAIRQQEAISRAAIAYRYGRSALPRPVSSPRAGIGHNSGDPRPLTDKPIASLRPGDTEPFVPGTLRTLMPNGIPLGSRYGRAGPNVYTLDQAAFNELVADILRGSVPATTPASYVDRGYWIELADRCIVGLRWSKDHGATLEIMKAPSELPFRRKLKFHRSER
jgi:hypothetical protein